MNPQKFRSDVPHRFAAEDPAADPLRGTLISLAFWMCLLGAVGMYGLVVLSPKVVRWSQKRAELEANQRQLLTLQQHVEYWDQLTRELVTNEEFRNSFVSTDHADETVVAEQITLDAALRYHSRAGEAPVAPVPQQPSRLMQVCHLVAASRVLQIVGLATSAGLLLYAFTSLLETPPQPRLPRKRRLRPHLFRKLGALRGRYLSAGTSGDAGKRRFRPPMTDV